MNALEKITARNCGYLVKKRMQTVHGIEPDGLQLQKLVYISFGYYGGVTEKYLFDDRIEAWKYGPVIPDLYYNAVEEPTHPVEKKIEITINTVVQTYERTPGVRLVSLTHSPGTPWRKVYREGENVEIPKDLIISHYRPIMKVLGFMCDSGLLDELARN